MGFTTYRELLRNRVVVRMSVISIFLRAPMWAAAIVLTLHVVTTLHHSYAAAGIVEMVFSLALAVSSPWRGRRLDRVGLRATVAPSLIVIAITWSIAPWLSYWPLLCAVLIGGLFMVPSFSIVRQVLIGAVPDRQRTAVLSVDSVFTEITFMIGPVLGVIAATYLDTRVALLVCQLAVVVGGIVLWIDNPSLANQDEVAEAAGNETGKRSHRGDLLTPAVLMVLAVAAMSTVVLTSEDLGVVAALRHMHASSAIGWTLALWGFGSAIGGIVYGSLHRHPPAAWLLLGLAASTAVVALAPNRTVFTVLLLASGFFCAPTITATVDDLSRAVPARARGEAMGWHGSALTLGGAAAAPIVGALIDGGGWPYAFGVIGLAGLAIAAIGLVILRRGRTGRKPESDPDAAVDLQRGEDLPGRLAPVEGVEVQAGSTPVQ